MKLKYILPAAAFACSCFMTSCVKDLEVNNANPQQVSNFNEDYIFNKIYGNLVLTGQTGPNGDSDLDDIDEGTSNMIRQLWNANELTTDEAHCFWNDPGLPEFNHNAWSDSHPMMKALYYRLMFGVTICNFYLDNATGGDAATKQKRAEARFMRALHYYYLMDLYANPPFLTTLSSENAPQIMRADLYAFLESELKDVIGEGSSDEILADARTTNYGRADKAAGYLLLARLYLNSEVYTGTAHWKEAKTYADKAIGTSYKLCTTPNNGFSPYQLLFMGDNDTNGAQDEIILPALHDGEKTQTWGGSLFLIASMYNVDEVADLDLYGATKADGTPVTGFGTSENWAGIRARKQFVQAFFPKANKDSDVPQGAQKDVVAKAGDDRALFFTKDHTLNMTDETKWTSGFAYVKFTNIHADGTSSHHAGGQFVDTDFPMLRLAEAYLISAEADARLNGGTCTAEGYNRIKALHDRANLTATNPLKNQTTFTLDDIIKEWSREFGFEGQRRMHLIRFGMYGGQSAYTWQWMGGSENGTQFDARFNIFPIPNSELNANRNLKQNEGF